MPTDPNWLPSTLAQATAALVAIIGGFLVSRLISLSVSRETLAQRRKSLGPQLDELALEWQRIHDERVAASAESLLDLNWDEWFGASGVVDLDDDFGARLPVGSTEEEMRPFAERDLALIREASEFYAKMPHTALPYDADELRIVAGPIEGHRLNVFLRVAKSLEREATSGTFLVSTAGLVGPFEVLQRERQDARIRRESEVGLQLRMLRREIDAIDDERKALALDPGIRDGVFMLNLFAALGILYPMIIMSLRPVPNCGAARWSMVAAFIIGFVMFVGYVGRRAAALHAGSGQMPSGVVAGDQPADF